MEDTFVMDFPAMVNGLTELPESAGALSFLNNHLPVMEAKLSLVRELLVQVVTDECFNAAINAIHFMIDKVPLSMIRLGAGAPIFRGRANGDRLFNRQEDISYNKEVPDRITAGRFNRPYEPLFYGSLRVETPKIDTVLHCALECCKELTDRDPGPIVQDITVGKWINRGEMPVVNLCFDERHLADNPDLKLSTDRFRRELAGFVSADACSFVFRFMQFFSELAWSVNKSENSYYIMNAFFHAVRYYYAETRNTAIPGIIYPSAMTEGSGLNIVLVPQAVDRFLRLDMVYMQRFFRTRGSNQFISAPCSELVHIKDGRFEFRKVKPYLKNGQLFTYGL